MSQNFSTFNSLTYSEAVDLCLSLADFERNTHSPNHSDFHLERMMFLADLLGDPQNSVPSVHIAGTKGKGSTSAMIASIIDASGKNVGLATSPHLHSLTERIKFCMRSIPKDDFAKLVSDLWPFVERTSAEGKASSVQFIHFNFSEKQIKKFKDLNTQVILGIDHNLYNHMTKISKDTKSALMKDFI